MAVLYRITAPNGLAYIGVTINLRQRMYAHKYDRRRSTLICRSLREHGRDVHKVETLCIGESEFLYDMERKLIEVCGTLAPRGLNITPGGFGGTSAKQSPEHIAKRLAHGVSEETRARNSLAAKRSWSRVGKAKSVATGRGAGRPKSPEHRAKLAAHLARFRNDEKRLTALRAVQASRKGL